METPLNQRRRSAPVHLTLAFSLTLAFVLGGCGGASTRGSDPSLVPDDPASVLPPEAEWVMRVDAEKLRTSAIYRDVRERFGHVFVRLLREESAGAERVLKLAGEILERTDTFLAAGAVPSPSGEGEPEFVIVATGGLSTEYLESVLTELQSIDLDRDDEGPSAKQSRQGEDGAATSHGPSFRFEARDGVTYLWDRDHGEIGFSPGSGFWVFGTPGLLTAARARIATDGPSIRSSRALGPLLSGAKFGEATVSFAARQDRPAQVAAKDPVSQAIAAAEALTVALGLEAGLSLDVALFEDDAEARKRFQLVVNELLAPIRANPMVRAFGLGAVVDAIEVTPLANGTAMHAEMDEGTLLRVLEQVSALLQIGLADRDEGEDESVEARPGGGAV